MMIISEDKTPQHIKESHSFISNCVIKKDFTTIHNNKIIPIKTGTILPYDSPSFYINKTVTLNILLVESNPDYFKINYEFENIEELRATNFSDIINLKVRCVPNYNLSHEELPDLPDSRYFMDGRVSRIANDNKGNRIITVNGKTILCKYHISELFVIDESVLRDKKINKLI